MKKDLRTVAFAAAVILSMSAGAASAAIRSEDGRIIINGAVEQKQEGLNVAIQIVGPFDSAVKDIDETLNRDLSQITYLEKTYYTEVVTGDGGKYSFEAPGIVQGKFYGVAVREPDGERITETMYIADEASIAAVLGMINSASGEADIRAVFENEQYRNMLVENYKIFSEITSDSLKQKVYKLIYRDKGTGFTSFAQLEQSIITSSAVVRTAEETDADKALMYIKYINLDNTDKKLFDKYDLGSNASKKNIVSRIMKQKPGSQKEYISLFEESCFLQLIKEEQYSSNISVHLKDYSNKFGIDLANYSKNETAVNKQLYGKEFASMGDFKTALKSAVSDAGTASGTTGGGSSGGNAGGNSSGSSVNVPPHNNSVVSTSNFDDLDSAEWARSSIENLANKGIISGKGDRRFCPGEHITREEFVKIAVSAFNLEDDNAETDFADLDKNSWSYKYVAAGVKAGLIMGIDENNFGGKEEITRQDIAAIIYRYLLSTGKEPAGSQYLFADDDKISEYAKDAVYALKADGILSGTGKNYFEPQRYATRAEAAKIIASVIGM